MDDRIIGSHKKMNGKVFDWYKAMLELGNYEAEFGAKRFHDAVTLHLAIAAGILALAAFAITNNTASPFIFCMVLSVLGAFNAALWMNEMDASRNWTKRWRRVAASIETTGFAKSASSEVHALSMSHTDTTEEIERKKTAQQEEDQRKANPFGTYLKWIGKCLWESHRSEGGTVRTENNSSPQTFWDDEKGLGRYATRWHFTARSFAWLYAATLVISVTFFILGITPWKSLVFRTPESKPSTNIVFVVASTNSSTLVHPVVYAFVPTNLLSNSNSLTNVVMFLPIKP